MPADAPLYLVHVEIDRARLFSFARQRRLPARDVDLGYLIHCALRGAFGVCAPQPFSFDDRGPALTLLGYGAHPSEALLDHVRRTDNVAAAIWRSGTLVSKPMPTAFAHGTRLRFSVRICPVLRKAAAGEKYRKGAEVDIFLARGWEAGQERPIDREATYGKWLTARLAARGAATVLTASMHAFRRERVVRSTHTSGESVHVRRSERPDAQFRGLLEVGNAEAFADLLRRGVGRHRAFGFGMLLLRPAGPGPC